MAYGLSYILYLCHDASQVLWHCTTCITTIDTIILIIHTNNAYISDTYDASQGGAAAAPEEHAGDAELPQVCVYKTHIKPI
jgi:hypothetical protein